MILPELGTVQALSAIHDLAIFISSANNVSIVAVHGLNGNAYRTWTVKGGSDGEEVLWLRDFLPPRLPRNRIMTFGYDARFLGPSISTLEDDAMDLHIRLRQLRLTTQTGSRPIVFIAHSLGGLVVKQALITAHSQADFSDILLSTRAILFMGTPHKGSKHATRAALLSRMLMATGLKLAKHRFQLLASNCDALSNLGDLFQKIAVNISITSFYETETTPGLGSVVSSSPPNVAPLTLAGRRQRISHPWNTR